jgi:hypothetical protein
MESITEAARSGDPRRLLEAMRDLVATQLDEGVPPRDMASLTKRLREITEDIAELDAAEKGDAVGVAAATPDAPLRVAS